MLSKLNAQRRSLRSIVGLILLPVGATLANAATLVPTVGYSVGQVMPTTTLGAYDIYSDGGTKSYAWDSNTGSLRQFDVSNGGVLSDLGTPPGGYSDSAFVSFVRRSPDGNSVWVGFTVGGNADDRIYEVTTGPSPTWNLRTTLAGNYDLEFSASGAPFASANLGGFGNPNKLFYLAASNGFSAIEFAETGGYSADLAFNASGSLVYATSGVAVNQLVSFSGSDVANFLGNPDLWVPLALSDAAVLSGLDAGSSGLFTDEFGGIYVALSDFSGFPFSGTLAQWNGILGEGDNLDILATASDSLGELDGLGLLAEGGELYQAVGFGQPGLATLTVPEPAHYGMAAGALALALTMVQRRRSRR